MAPNNFIKDVSEGFLKECVTEFSAGEVIDTGVMDVIQICCMILKDLFISRL
jgi:hypothetical protein